MRILYLFFIVLACNQLFAQTTIEEARRQNIGQTVSISGIVTNGDELGLIKYVQDSTAGIAVYDDKLSDIKRGDSITVSGKLDDYYNLLEIKDVSTINTHSVDNLIPEPNTLTIDKIGEDYESQLIKIDNIEFVNASGTFAGNTNYEFTDGSETGTIRISSYSPIVKQSIPSGKISVVAICSQYSYDNNDTRNGYQLLPRDMDDFISGSSVNITSAVEVVEITKNTISLSWRSDISAAPFVRYGNAMNEENLSTIKAGDSTTGEENFHIVQIDGLQPSEIIYAQVFNVNEGDTVFSSIGAYVTESNSTGIINVYFNTSVDESLANKTIAKDINNAMEDTLAAYIDKAEESIDFCIYNFDNRTISDALNAAHNRGVKIRFITCGSTNHYGVNDLDDEIPILERPEIADNGIMHNKFAIFDANSSNANNSWVWSGSTNLTQSQLFSDANNMIFIQDQSLALTYKTEFEEMWGSTGNTPNASSAKFGNKKINNTPHELLVGGNKIECYFSPSDNTNQKLIDAMASADDDLNVQTMLITRADLANAIMDAADRGVNVDVICDDERDISESVNDILNDLPADKYIFDDAASGTLHHKVALIDANTSSSNPQVITGSHNWSYSANDKNDENTLIIHDADITNQYYQQFAYRFEQNGGDFVISAHEVLFEDLKIYPNPTTNRVQVVSSQGLTNVKLYSIQGSLIAEISDPITNRLEIDLGQQTNGIYILKIESTQNQVNTYKIIKK